MKREFKKIIPSIFRESLQNVRGKSVYHSYYDKYNCIFIHIPKAAGQSVGLALFNDRHPGHWRLKDFEWENKNKKEKYTKFTIVRNPWDRVVSAYNYLVNHTKYKTDQDFSKLYLKDYSDFNDFILHGLRKDEVINWVHFRPQLSFLEDENGNIDIDFIGRFENIQNDFNSICKIINIDTYDELKIHNSGDREKYQSYYNEETRNVVRDVYEKDIEYFNYKFED